MQPTLFNIKIATPRGAANILWQILPFDQSRNLSRQHPGWFFSDQIWSEDDQSHGCHGIYERGNDDMEMLIGKTIFISLLPNADASMP